MVSEAQGRATRKYRAKTYDRIEVQVPKGTRDHWRALAEQEGKSLNAYIVSCVERACQVEKTAGAPALGDPGEKTEQ